MHKIVFCWKKVGNIYKIFKNGQIFIQGQIGQNIYFDIFNKNNIFYWPGYHDNYTNV